MKQKTEILAPAGGMKSLVAAVRSGANAVYLGAAQLNARQGAENFDKTLLKQAVSYCHARGVLVHQTLNTIVFDDELELAEKLIKEAAGAGVDAFIIQDLGVFELAKSCAPEIQCHASTQMAIHNLEGVKKLYELGFTRAVLARELSLQELEYIVKNSPIEIETFVHGALCMSVSGQCYLSSMIGGRSGNRGQCAQPCRLPFASEKSSHALSLKDMSVIEYLPELAEMGITSFKIEGRLKREEYVAAAVTACKEVLAGKTPDYESLKGVFSRSGFTKGYFENKLGEGMFGTRTKEDVLSSSVNLKQLAELYNRENPLVRVDFKLIMKKAQPTKLTIHSGEKTVEVEGEIPETAISAPTNRERAEKSLSKTGNTPFYLGKLNCEIDDGIMLPASALNNLRRDALEKLLEELETVRPKRFTSYCWPETTKTHGGKKKPQVRVRISGGNQLTGQLAEFADWVILPISEGLKLASHKDKIILELPQITFSKSGVEKIKGQLEAGKKLGFKNVLVGGIDKIQMAKALGYKIHGDFSLNAVNCLAAEQYKKLGLESLTMSIEYPVRRETKIDGIATGIVVYGSLPMMSFRNHPAGLSKPRGILTDRLGNKFLVNQVDEVSVMYNSVPLFLGDQIADFQELDFSTFYFTEETQEECLETLKSYQAEKKSQKSFTRGLYKRRVK